MKLILASKSPRRKEILSRLKIPFDIVISTIDESQFNTIKSPSILAKQLAFEKSSIVSKNHPNDLVIGADTIVILNNEIMCKPKNKKNAMYMLNKLSGNTHKVITAISIQCIDLKINHTFHEETNVTFRKIPKRYLITYIDSDCPYDKAGSYGIQDWSSIFVKHINGCYDNVVGFPLSRFIIELEKSNINFYEIS